MGKLHQWRKHSYVRVENDGPGSGCALTLLRVLGYSRWYNVRNMFHYKKQKFHDKNPQSKVNPDYQYQINDDALMLDSASVNSSSTRALSTSIAGEDNEDEVELSTPTLLSRLKADPKLDSPRKRGLCRSGTFPCPNSLHNLGFGRTPCKLEDKHTEIWPVKNYGYELRKDKSVRITRSSSLNEITLLVDRDHLHLLRKSIKQKGLDNLKNAENLKEKQLDEGWVSFVDEKGQSNYQEQQQIEDIISANAENSLPIEDLAQISNIYPNENADNLEKEIEDYNEGLEYVKHVLDVLGFVGPEEVTEEFLDEALDPELFDEIEVLCPFDPKPATKYLARLDRKVLFHLTIEALVYIIYDKLFAYYAQTRAMHMVKTRIVEKVWKFATEYLNWRPEFDPKLDLAMASDLTKSSWKNHQMEIEHVGQDLEDLIFDELLDEILCC